MPMDIRMFVATVAMLSLAGCSGTVPEGGAAATEPTPEATGAPDMANAPVYHAHDYYREARELTLMDAAVDLTVAHNHMFDQPPREQHTHGCQETLASSSQGGTVKFSLPPGSIVPPGTSRLNVTASWDMPSITGMRLLYRPPSHDHAPSDHQHMEHNDFMDAGPLENGRPVSLEVTPTTTDQGHQFHSNWAFFLCAAGEEPVQLAEGSVDLEVVARRADQIPVDPPHPDHWNNSTRLALGSLSWSGRATSVANQGDAWFQITLDDGAIVPWGTDHVLVLANLTGAGMLDETVPFDVSLWYRDASSVEWDYQRLEGDGPAEERRFIIPIYRGDAEDEDALDSPYAQRSHWDFWLRVASETGTTAPMTGHWTAPHVFEGSIDASVWAMATAA